MKTTIIINEQHALLTQQKDILKSQFGEWETLKVPSTGWTKSERDKICNGICGNVVFVSPIQGMILDLATRSQQEASECGKLSLRPWVFSNDTREKIELPNGEVISVLAKTGWYLE